MAKEEIMSRLSEELNHIEQCGEDEPFGFNVPRQYGSLKYELESALCQASLGKGKERHANDEPFEHQKICVITRLVKGSPAAPLLYQAIKKAIESVRMDTDHALHELDGAINYLAAAKIILREERTKDTEEKPSWACFDPR